MEGVIITSTGRVITIVPHLDTVRRTIPLKSRFSWSALPVENIMDPKSKMGMSMYVAEKDEAEAREWAGKN